MVVRHRLALILLSIAGLTAGCRSPCGGVSGSCMVIELDSAENIDALELKLRVKDPIDGTERIVQPSGGALLRVGRSDKIRLLPPPGVDSAQITAISLLARRESGECFQYSHAATDWPSGTTQSLTATFQIPPRITGLTPTQGPTSGGTQVDLAGENFIEGMEVLWGGAAPVRPQIQNPRTARTQSLAVPAWTPGQPTKVAVRDPAGCQTNEVPQGFQHYAGEIEFSPEEQRNGRGAIVHFDIAVGNLNNDKNLDLVSVGKGASKSDPGVVTIFYGDNQGQFSDSNTCTIATTMDPSSVAVGYYTIPRKPAQDIVVTHGDRTVAPMAHRIYVHKSHNVNPENCSLWQEEQIDITSHVWPNTAKDSNAYLRSIAANDLNKDGIDDFVATGYIMDRTITLISDTDGSHKVQTYINNSNFDQRWLVSFFDLDQNGYDDIILANYSNNSIDTLLVKSLAGGAAVDILPSSSIKLPNTLGGSGAYPVSVFPRQVSGSTALDVIFSRAYDPGLGLIRCAAGWNSCPLNIITENDLSTIDVNSTIKGGNHMMAHADFNGDGFSDLAISSDVASKIYFVVSDKNGELGRVIEKNKPIGCGITRLFAADLNADRKPDLVAVGKGGTCNLGAVLVLYNSSH